MGYTAIVLDPESRTKVMQAFESLNVNFKDYVFHTKSGSPLSHHMTINMGQPDLDLNPSLEIGDEVEMLIDGICYCKHLGVAACRVVESGRIVSANEQAHITVAIQSHGKPVNSNKLAWEQGNWHPLSLKVNGTIQVCD